MRDVVDVDVIVLFVVCCGRVQSPRFGYALANGTVGVYNNTSRLWRLKSKSTVSCITSYDIDGDGVPELVSGWTSGKLEARREANAELVYRDHFSAPLSALTKVRRPRRRRRRRRPPPPSSSLSSLLTWTVRTCGV